MVWQCDGHREPGARASSTHQDPDRLGRRNRQRRKLVSIRDRIVGARTSLLALSGPEDQARRREAATSAKNPGTFVPGSKILAQLQPDEISEPFRTQYGWHIIQLLGRRQYDSTEDRIRQQAFTALREAKADEETELRLRRLRDEAYVEYKL